MLWFRAKSARPGAHRTGHSPSTQPRHSVHAAEPQTAEIWRGPEPKPAEPKPAEPEPAEPEPAEPEPAEPEAPTQWIGIVDDRPGPGDGDELRWSWTLDVGPAPGPLLLTHAPGCPCFVCSPLVELPALEPGSIPVVTVEARDLFPGDVIQDYDHPLTVVDKLITGGRVLVDVAEFRDRLRYSAGAQLHVSGRLG